MNKQWWQQMKRFFAFAWRRSADEKIPLSTKKCVTDNGTITKPPPSSKQPTEKAEKEKMADGKGVVPDVTSPECEPMTWLRKFAMFLSFNIIALYFVVFAWLIPCKPLHCQSGQEWTVVLDNVSISTNLEVGPPSSELLLFGYHNSSEGSNAVTALITSTGSVTWRRQLEYTPVYCRCNVVDINADSIMDCLIFGEARLLALNASNGFVYWIQKFRAISSLVAKFSGCDNSEWIVIIEDQGSRDKVFTDQPQGGLFSDLEKQELRISMVILDSKNATVVKIIPLRCDFFPKQLATWKSETNVTHIAFQCSYKGKTEVQVITEEDLCNMVFGRSSSEMRGFSSPFFSFGSSTAVDDVFLLPVSHVGLMVGWSTVVAMATDARNPPRLLWQPTSGSIRAAIKFVLGGSFTSGNSTQITIVIRDGSSNLVKVVDALDGKEVSSVDLGRGAVLSILLVPRTTENGDSLLIVKEGGRTVSNRTGSDGIDFPAENSFFASTPDASRGIKTYLLLTFGKENNVTELLNEDRKTVVAVRSGDCTVVFFATWLSNETTRISSRILKDSSKSSCYCR